MNKRNYLLICSLFSVAFLLLLASACAEKSSNSANTNSATGYTANRITATRESLTNMKMNANQRANATDAIISGNSNGVDSH